MRIRDHMSLHNILGEVLTVSIPQRYVAACEHMLKMSLLDLRPKLSRGTEIAEFDSREKALLCISTYQGYLTNFTSSSYIPANYNNLDGPKLTVTNYKDDEHKERRVAAQKLNFSGIELTQAYLKEKRGKYVLVLCV